MKLRGVILLILVAMMLGGCGDSSLGLTKEDLSISKIEDSKAKIVYGMDRSDVENVLGKGEKSSFGFAYDSGVNVMYRDDIVAGISIDEDAANVFQTPDIKIGMLKGDILKEYGEDNVLYNAPKSLDYAYDTKEGVFLTEKSKRKENAEQMQDVYMVSVTFDDDGYAERILLLDQRMAIHMN
ncbi:hypothetical protein JJQ72_06370 [Paenibacillus sp. F411]|uniref:hypothetical protein n=1 Tax=Paenibacillus sp. F411 TaxID=2820239 RepID=UPI001AAF43EC|nr:hypothetical protein [Paenibacillus sp. F411]MBO2943602.1 hypothetical protein [Paenibacillus sp. F411]